MLAGRLDSRRLGACGFCGSGCCAETGPERSIEAMRQTARTRCIGGLHCGRPKKSARQAEVVMTVVTSGCAMARCFAQVRDSAGAVCSAQAIGALRLHRRAHVVVDAGLSEQ